MNSLAYMTIRAQLLATQSAIAELELKVAQRHDEIKRVEEHLKLQEKREAELTIELNKLKEGE